MPVFVEDGITLTLPSGDTVTLYERNISVAERKDMRKRMTVVGSEIGFKQKQAEKIDKRREAIESDESLNGQREALLAQVNEEAGELISSIDLIEFYADGLSRRFESWDVYETKADAAANNPVPLTKDAIMKYCEKPARARLINDIVEALGEYDKREGKGSAAPQGNFGEPFKTEAPTVQ